MRRDAGKLGDGIGPGAGGVDQLLARENVATVGRHRSTRHRARRIAAILAYLSEAPRQRGAAGAHDPAARHADRAGAPAGRPGHARCRPVASPKQQGRSGRGPRHPAVRAARNGATSASTRSSIGALVRPGVDQDRHRHRHRRVAEPVRRGSKKGRLASVSARTSGVAKRVMEHGRAAAGRVEADRLLRLEHGDLGMLAERGGGGKTARSRRR